MKNLKTILLFLFASGAINLFAQDDFKKLDSIVSNHLYSISFVDENVGYIGGANAMLLKTVDGGKSWSKVATKTAPWTFSRMDFVNMQFLSEDTGNVIVRNFNSTSDYDNVIWETINGGIDWTLLEVKVNMLPECFLFTGYRKGLVGGTAWFQGNMIAQMKPDTWVNVQSFDWNGFTVIDVATHNTDQDFSMAVSDDGYVYRTFNNGLLWDTLPAYFEHKIHSVIYSEPNWIITVDSSTSIFYSTDSGQTWKGQLTTFGYPQYQDVSLSSTDSLVYAGINGFNLGEISYSKNGNPYLYQNTPMKLWATGCNPNGDAFVVGDNGAIYRRKGNTTSIRNASIKKIGVYPNPVRSTLNFKEPIEGMANVYSISGRLVLSSRLEHSTLNLKGLKAGYYFIEYTVIRSKEMNQVKVLKLD